MSKIMDSISQFFDSPQLASIPQLTPVNIAMLIVAIVLASGGVDAKQAGFAFVGAVVYAGICTLRFEPVAPKRMASKGVRPKKAMNDSHRSRSTAARPSERPSRKAPSQQQPYHPHSKPYHPHSTPNEKHHLSSSRQIFKQFSIQPITAPTFSMEDFESQVDELVVRLTPSAEGDKILQGIVAAVQDTVVTIVPEAEVVGFACGDPRRGAAFGVALPEVDIVISVHPEVLSSRMNGRKKPRDLRGQGPIDDWKLQKSALRAFTAHLVSHAGFKFRRSAFRGQEPKVTLLAPPTGGHGEATPMDLSVNSVAPLWHGALVTECAQIEPRAQALILLVRRWAKDRAICHVAKGHLSPHAWSLLAIFFLQVGATGEGALLPSLESFEMASQIGCAGSSAPPPPPAHWTPPPTDFPKKSVADLLREFFHFYHAVFDWRSEAVSIRAAARAAPSLRLPLHVLADQNGETLVAPSIEDPFDSTHNFGAVTTCASLVRFHEELERAAGMCGRSGSLTDLLAPWAPPDEMDSETPPTLAQQDELHEDPGPPMQITGFEYQ